MRKYILIILILCLLLNGCVEEASESETDDMSEGINEINEIEKEINENELDDFEDELSSLDW